MAYRIFRLVPAAAPDDPHWDPRAQSRRRRRPGCVARGRPHRGEPGRSRFSGETCQALAMVFRRPSPAPSGTTNSTAWRKTHRADGPWREIAPS